MVNYKTYKNIGQEVKKGRKIGNCRVTADELNLGMQEQVIQKYADDKGMELILYVERISIGKVEREEL